MTRAAALPGAAVAAALMAGCSAPPEPAEHPTVRGTSRTVKATLVAAEPCPETEPGAGCAAPAMPSRRARVVRPLAGSTLRLDAGAPAWLVSAWVGARRRPPAALPPAGQPPGTGFRALRVRPAGRDGRRWRLRLPRTLDVEPRLLHLFVAYRDDVGPPFAVPRLSEGEDNELRWARWEVRIRVRRAGS